MASPELIEQAKALAAQRDTLPPEEFARRRAELKAREAAEAAPKTPPAGPPAKVVPPAAPKPGVTLGEKPAPPTAAQRAGLTSTTPDPVRTRAVQSTSRPLSPPTSLAAGGPRSTPNERASAVAAVGVAEAGRTGLPAQATVAAEAERYGSKGIPEHPGALRATAEAFKPRRIEGENYVPDALRTGPIPDVAAPLGLTPAVDAAKATAESTLPENIGRGALALMSFGSSLAAEKVDEAVRARVDNDIGLRDESALNRFGRMVGALSSTGEEILLNTPAALNPLAVVAGTVGRKALSAPHTAPTPLEWSAPPKDDAEALERAETEVDRDTFSRGVEMLRAGVGAIPGAVGDAVSNLGAVNPITGRNVFTGEVAPTVGEAALGVTAEERGLPWQGDRRGVAGAYIAAMNKIYEGTGLMDDFSASVREAGGDETQQKLAWWTGFGLSFVEPFEELAVGGAVALAGRAQKGVEVAKAARVAGAPAPSPLLSAVSGVVHDSEDIIQGTSRPFAQAVADGNIDVDQFGFPLQAGMDARARSMGFAGGLPELTRAAQDEARAERAAGVASAPEPEAPRSPSTPPPTPPAPTPAAPSAPASASGVAPAIQMPEPPSPIVRRMQELHAERARYAADPDLVAYRHDDVLDQLAAGQNHRLDEVNGTGFRRDAPQGPAPATEGVFEGATRARRETQAVDAATFKAAERKRVADAALRDGVGVPSEELAATEAERAAARRASGTAWREGMTDAQAEAEALRRSLGDDGASDLAEEMTPKRGPKPKPAPKPAPKPGQPTTVYVEPREVPRRAPTSRQVVERAPTQPGGEPRQIEGGPRRITEAPLVERTPLEEDVGAAPQLEGGARQVEGARQRQIGEGQEFTAEDGPIGYAYRQLFEETRKARAGSVSDGQSAHVVAAYHFAQRHPELGVTVDMAAGAKGVPKELHAVMDAFDPAKEASYRLVITGEDGIRTSKRMTLDKALDKMIERGVATDYIDNDGMRTIATWQTTPSAKIPDGYVRSSLVETTKREGAMVQAARKGQEPAAWASGEVIEPRSTTQAAAAAEAKAKAPPKRTRKRSGAANLGLLWDTAETALWGNRAGRAPAPKLTGARAALVSVLEQTLRDKVARVANDGTMIHLGGSTWVPGPAGRSILADTSRLAQTYGVDFKSSSMSLPEVNKWLAAEGRPPIAQLSEFREAQTGVYIERARRAQVAHAAWEQSYGLAYWLRSQLQAGLATGAQKGSARAGMADFLGNLMIPEATKILLNKPGSALDRLRNNMIDLARELRETEGLNTAEALQRLTMSWSPLDASVVEDLRRAQALPPGTPHRGEILNEALRRATLSQAQIEQNLVWALHAVAPGEQNIGERLAAAYRNNPEKVTQAWESFRQQATSGAEFQEVAAALGIRKTVDGPRAALGFMLRARESRLRREVVDQLLSEGLALPPTQGVRDAFEKIMSGQLRAESLRTLPQQDAFAAWNAWLRLGGPIARPVEELGSDGMALMLSHVRGLIEDAAREGAPLAVPDATWKRLANVAGGVHQFAAVPILVGAGASRTAAYAASLVMGNVATLTMTRGVGQAATSTATALDAASMAIARRVSTVEGLFALPQDLAGITFGERGYTFAEVEEAARRSFARANVPVDADAVQRVLDIQPTGYDAKLWRVASGAFDGATGKFLGGRVAGAMDLYGRVGVMIDELRRGASLEQASAVARESFYSLDGMTSIERNLFRRTMSFYAFQRADLVNTAWTLVNNPDRWLRSMRTQLLVGKAGPGGDRTKRNQEDVPRVPLFGGRYVDRGAPRQDGTSDQRWMGEWAWSGSVGAGSMLLETAAAANEEGILKAGPDVVLDRMTPEVGALLAMWRIDPSKIEQGSRAFDPTASGMQIPNELMEGPLPVRQALLYWACAGSIDTPAWRDPAESEVGWDGKPKIWVAGGSCEKGSASQIAAAKVWGGFSKFGTAWIRDYRRGHREYAALVSPSMPESMQVQPQRGYTPTPTQIMSDALGTTYRRVPTDEETLRRNRDRDVRELNARAKAAAE